MELQGYFTNKGLALAAKLASGATLKITRVTAGAGKTGNPAAAAALPLPKQQLAVNPPLRRGNTAVLPVTLTAALASSAYDLTELGVYAMDPNEGEILYKLYKLPEAMKVDPTSCLVLRFYLEETVSQDLGVTVVCSPAGLITEADFAPIRNKVELTEVPSRHVPLAASELQSYINAMPRLLTEHLYLEPAGKLDTAVEVSNFYGPGGLTIVGNRGFSMRNALHIQNCSLPVMVHTIEFQERADMSSPIMVYAERSGQVRIYNCGFTGLGAESVARAAAAQMISAIQMTRVRISGFYNAVMSDCGSILSFGTSEGENISAFSGNAVGAYAWGGGMVLLGAGIPDLLGGNAHQKLGGIIAKADGTLL